MSIIDRISTLNEFLNRKLLDVEYQLKAYCIEAKLQLAIMEMNDNNIDIDHNRLCCWIDDKRMIRKFTRG